MTLEDSQLYRTWNYCFDLSSQRLAQPNIAYSVLKKYLNLIYVLKIKLFVVIHRSNFSENIFLVNTLNVVISTQGLQISHIDPCLIL